MHQWVAVENETLSLPKGYELWACMHCGEQVLVAFPRFEFTKTD